MALSEKKRLSGFHASTTLPQDVPHAPSTSVRSRLLLAAPYFGYLALIYTIIAFFLSPSRGLLPPSSTGSEPGRVLGLRPPDRDLLHPRHLEAIARIRNIAVQHWRSPSPLGKLHLYNEDSYAFAPFVPARVQPFDPATPVGSGYRHQKMVLPQRPLNNRTTVPHVIWQKWNVEVVGPITYMAMTSWIEQNPEYDYVLFNDEAEAAYAASWMVEDDHALDAVYAKVFAPTSLTHARPRSEADDPKNHFVPDSCFWVDKLPGTSLALTKDERKRLRAAYKRVVTQSTKSDFLRFFLSYDVGGNYFDADTVSVRPLREWVDPSATFVTGKGFRGDPHSWGMIVPPRHPLVAQVLRLILANFESRDDLQIQIDVDAVAGPAVLHQAFRELLCSPAHHYAVAQGLQYFNADFYDGRVIFKAAGIKNEWDARGHPDWLETAFEANNRKKNGGVL